METEEKANDLEFISKIATDIRQLDSSVIYARLNSEYASRRPYADKRLLKVDGSVFCLVTKGKLRISFNFEEFDVIAPAVMSLPHGSMISLAADITEPSEGYLIAYSQSFLQDVNISFSIISGEALMERKTPVLKLSDRDVPLLLRYFSLIETTLGDIFNTQLTRHIISSLSSAMFYQMILLMYKDMENYTPESTAGMGPRRSSYVHDFIKLVHRHYATERSVNFYADKLFISPKYLSLLVKEATGRTAARWIDSFIIMEAKNLLRYSGKNIQQVAYALNFGNQSAFGKYFKNLTGMSPTEFQKS